MICNQRLATANQKKYNAIRKAAATIVQNAQRVIVETLPALHKAAEILQITSINKINLFYPQFEQPLFIKGLFAF